MFASTLASTSLGAHKRRRGNLTRYRHSTLQVDRLPSSRAPAKETYSIRDSSASIWKKEINQTCHGCRNGFGPKKINPSAGFAVCCGDGCSTSHKWWCENCLLKYEQGWPDECFEELNNAQPEQSKQKLDWKCPHCSNTVCPSSACTSIQQDKPQSNTQTSRVNPYHGAPPPAQSARVPIEQQMEAALQLWEEGKIDVCRLSSSMVALPAWDPKNCCFRKVEPPLAGHSTLPVVVRMRGPGDIVCDGATDTCTCQPRGQCVHILLCHEKKLLDLPEAQPPRHPRGHEAASPSSSEEVASTAVEGAPSAAEPPVEPYAETPVDAWMYIPNAQAVLATELDAAGECWFNAIFLVNAGIPTDPTAVNWVHVKDARWKCSARLHRSDSSERHPCGCMNTVMDALGLTAEDLMECAAEAELGAALCSEPSAAYGDIPSISVLPRVMHLQHGEPCIHKYCIPEAVVVALEEAGLHVSALHSKQSGEEVLSTLGELFQGQVCTTHKQPYTVMRHRARVTDGTTNPMQYCEVFSLCCDVADGSVPCSHVYDGSQDDLFNLNNSELFTHRMLINCLHDVRYKGSSFNAIREVALAHQRALPASAQEAIVSLPVFLRAFFGYTELLTELPGFTCKICGQYPAAIIVDGTGYKLFDKHLQPMRSFGHPSHDEQTRVLAWSDRKLVKTPAARALLLRFSQGRASSKCQPLSEEQLAQLVVLLEREAAAQQPIGNSNTYTPAQCIADLLLSCPAERCGDGLKCAEVFADVLYHLGSDHSSDTVLVQSEVAHTALKRLVSTWQESGLDLEQDNVILHQDARVLYEMLVRCEPLFEQDGGLSGKVLRLVEFVVLVWQVAIGCASPDTSQSVLLASLPGDTPAHSHALSQADLAVYDPHWPILFTRPRYVGLELENGRSRDSSVYRKCDNTRPLVGSSQRKFSPGICKFSCVHGVVLGFHFMKEPESPSDVFTLLLTRFPREQLPSIVFYDNGCKLYEYILNREPWMLKSMRIFVDTFHYGSWRTVPIHKCPCSFDGKSHAVAGLFNSQYEEHGNAFISIHKRSARTMSLKRARMLLSVLLQSWNEGKFMRTQLGGDVFVQQFNAACASLGR